MHHVGDVGFGSEGEARSGRTRATSDVGFGSEGEARSGRTRATSDVAEIELIHHYPVAEFVDAVLAELHGRGHVDARFEAAGFLVRLDADRRLLVDRLFAELQQVPADARPGHIAARVDAALRPLPAVWPEVSPLLRAVLRPASYTGAVTADGNRPWIRPLWPFVHVLALVDTGAARAVVTARDTAAWGVSGEQMFAAARSNIAARYPPQPQPERVGFLRGDGNSYCDSAVLVTGWLNAFADDAGPRPLVFFPGDEVLLVCTDDPEVAPEFFAAAERIHRQAVVPISPQAYTIVGDTLLPLDLAGPGPARSLAVRARSVLADAEYRVQTERLARHFAEQTQDVQVASVQLIETPRGSCTMTIWPDGTPVLLPEADYVTLLSADQTDYFTVPFGVLADVLGLLTDAELMPVRFPVTGWPDAATLAVLRDHAVRLPGI